MASPVKYTSSSSMSLDSTANGRAIIVVHASKPLIPSPAGFDMALVEPSLRPPGYVVAPGSASFYGNGCDASSQHRQALLQHCLRGDITQEDYTLSMESTIVIARQAKKDIPRPGATMTSKGNKTIFKAPRPNFRHFGVLGIPE